MRGNFGVFDRAELLAEFGDSIDAEEHREDLLEVNLPEHMRCSPYEYDDLCVYEIPRNYEVWQRLLVGLRRMRNQELSVLRSLQVLQAAQRERSEGRSAAA